MIELTINGKKIKTEKGATILRAALDNGIKIPNLCYDKRVAPYGGCRICIVEIEGERKLEASCATLAAEGMVVWTNTPKVRKVRQTVLELMLTHHPLDCPVCDKAGECDLQDLVFEYGKPTGRFVRERKHTPPDVRGPLVELTANRCILCGRCVRICAEHQGRGALGFIGRGFPTVVQAAFGEANECDYCGQCIDVCPTGAILSKPYKFKARQWYLEETDTICPFCSCGCTLTLGTMKGRIVRSRGKEDNGVSEGNLCGRGRFGFDYIYSENRLTAPLLRKNGELVPVSWEEALGYVSDTLKHLIAVNGPSSIGAIGSPRCTNEDNYIFQKFMREVVGSGNIDSSCAFGYGLAEEVWNKAFGLKGHGIDLKSPLGKEVILVIESDPTITHPVFGLNILKAEGEGSQLIAVDSRETKLTQHSTQWVRIKQGTGAALLNGVMSVMVDKGLIDAERAANIPGFPELKAALREYTPEKVRSITGIPPEEVAAIAKELAGAKTRMLSLSLSASENVKDLNTAMAAANLVNLLGESPAALQIPAEYANTFGLYQLGIRPDAGPGYQPPRQLSGVAGVGVFEMLYGLKLPNALYIMGADPVVTFPDAAAVVNRLKSLNLLIVQDIALTETAKLAHVVLPAASWAERDGTFTNAEGVVQKISKIVDPPGQALPDWQIVRGLALAFGKDIGVRKREDIAREISALPGAALNRLPVARAFNRVDYMPGEEPDGEYPLRLVLRDVMQHVGSMTTRSQTLDLVAPEAKIEINRKDAERFGIHDKNHVKVTSRRGTVYLKADVSDEVPDGAVYVSAHFPHGGVNILTHSSRTAGGPTDTVRVEAA